jgi:NAD(P)-dependent dehydrogenase (short-subunit alcohol dehydrogenase family)
MEDYKGKLAVITGGASGIGLGIAAALADRGCNIVITDINKEKGKAAEDSLSAKGTRTVFIEHDVSNEASWDAVISNITKKFHNVDYLFNNAGIMLRIATLNKVTIKDWQWIVGVNLWGPLYGLRKFTELMEKQDIQGKIITTASTAAVAPFSTCSAYSACKAAIVRLVECYEAEAILFKKDKVKYSVIMPGVVETNILNCELNRPPEYCNSDLPPKVCAIKGADTVEGDLVGKISVDTAVDRILKQIDYGNLYIYTHRNLTSYLIIEQTNAMLLNKAPVDQMVVDYEYYRRKKQRRKI